METSSKVLPHTWVSRLFLRFQAIYGNRLTTMWGDADPDEVKTAWGIELGCFEADDIKWALECLKTTYLDFPPTLYQFRALCVSGRSVREQRTRRLNAPPAAPPPPEVLAKIHQLVSKMNVAPRQTVHVPMERTPTLEELREADEAGRAL